jgi:pyruvate-formate lyase-activating enzyme
VTGFVSNGNGTPQVLEFLRPSVDLYKVDLKSFDDRQWQREIRRQFCRDKSSSAPKGNPFGKDH